MLDRSACPRCGKRMITDGATLVGFQWPFCCDRCLAELKQHQAFYDEKDKLRSNCREQERAIDAAWERNREREEY